MIDTAENETNLRCFFHRPHIHANHRYIFCKEGVEPIAELCHNLQQTEHSFIMTKFHRLSNLVKNLVNPTSKV